ncbi:conserved Plasmodium protein, unknown function [Plasmodium gallinaceum]|uniref:Uncharacterized protein n=1 Tax=Plasmodium gallinaceum TaxID=5849 RepID=A0A1J1GR16_PLAGA|nr:conserved Plasmodium protein, unknown function [Plasmodium gallinaceum]CRG94983.1 conserved Plasmodium protein, unknown function [Plasmodium gallinaceum]
MTMVLNHIKKSNIYIPGVINQKILGNLNRGNVNYSKELIKNKNVNEEKNLQNINENLDIENIDYKYSPYLKPLEIKGIKRADRKLDYNSSYSFMVAQKDFRENLKKQNIFTKYLYNGMKIPLPPKKYKLSQYIDVRLDMFSPLIISFILSVPFFIASNM